MQGERRDEQREARRQRIEERWREVRLWHWCARKGPNPIGVEVVEQRVAQFLGRPEHYSLEHYRRLLPDQERLFEELRHPAWNNPRNYM